MPNTNDHMTTQEQYNALIVRLADNLKIIDRVNELEKEVAICKARIEDLQKSPQPVYHVHPPKDATLRPEDCPVEGKGGFWVSQEEYAKRIGIKSSTLTSYRKADAGARWSSDGTWGETKRGEHIFKPIDPSKSNSKTVWWVRSK